MEGGGLTFSHEYSYPTVACLGTLINGLVLMTGTTLFTDSIEAVKIGTVICLSICGCL